MPEYPGMALAAFYVASLITYAARAAMLLFSGRRMEHDDDRFLLDKRQVDGLNDGSAESSIILHEVRTKCLCSQYNCRRMRNGQCTLDCISIGEGGRCAYMDLKN